MSIKDDEFWAIKRAEQDYLASIPGVIKTLEKEITNKQKELANLQALYAIYPDLQRDVNRWKTVRYCSPSVNSKVQHCEIRHNCGCCNDSPLEIWPYLDTEHGTIYSSPASFQVGEQHRISGDFPYNGWKEKLKAAEIPEVIIDMVRTHFRAGAEDRKQMAEESDYEDEDDVE